MDILTVTSTYWLKCGKHRKRYSRKQVVQNCTTCTQIVKMHAIKSNRVNLTPNYWIQKAKDSIISMVKEKEIRISLKIHRRPNLARKEAIKCNKIHFIQSGRQNYNPPSIAVLGGCNLKHSNKNVSTNYNFNGRKTLWFHLDLITKVSHDTILSIERMGYTSIVGCL